MHRRLVALVTVLVFATFLPKSGTRAQAPQDVPNRSQAVTFNVVEATIPQMQAAMAAGSVTSRDLVAAYLARIAQYEPTLNATISVNLNAYSEA